MAVTGATGIVGGGVARRLAAAGIPQRLIVRSAEPDAAIPAAEVAVASYGDARAPGPPGPESTRCSWCPAPKTRTGWRTT